MIDSVEATVATEIYALQDSSGGGEFCRMLPQTTNLSGISKADGAQEYLQKLWFQDGGARSNLLPSPPHSSSVTKTGASILPSLLHACRGKAVCYNCTNLF